MPVQILLPTTDALNQILRIEAAERLTASQVRHTVHWMPLPISKHYHAMTARGGLLGDLGPPFRHGAYRLLLKLPVESGNSWELPVVIAHHAVELGHELTEKVATGDTVFWATGEVDGRLGIRVCNYWLHAKVAHSRAGLAEAAAAGARIVALVPACEDVAPLRELLDEIRARDAIIETVHSVGAACRIVEQALNGTRRTALRVAQRANDDAPDDRDPALPADTIAVTPRSEPKTWALLGAATALMLAGVVISGATVGVPSPDSQVGQTAIPGGGQSPYQALRTGEAPGVGGNVAAPQPLDASWARDFMSWAGQSRIDPAKALRGRSSWMIK
jgi:hypothetical protein